jgi:hypothetical protein
LQRYETVDISVKGKVLHALIADSFVKHMIGLMFRQRMGKDTCMLFIFQREARQGIWMRNMRFPIDILWLDSSKKVVDFVEAAMPASRRIYAPEKDAKYVLETNAGFIRRNRIKKGVAIRNAL